MFGVNKNKTITPKEAGELNPTGKSGPVMRTPQFKKEIAEILQEEALDPARAIAKAIHEMEALHKEHRDKLDMRQHLEYYRTFIGANERLLTYVYTRKAIEHISEKTTVNVDYNAMIEQLNQKAFGGVDETKVTNALEQYAEKLTNQVKTAKTPKIGRPKKDRSVTHINFTNTPSDVQILQFTEDEPLIIDSE